jgi:hypothetical protein
MIHCPLCTREIYLTKLKEFRHHCADGRFLAHGAGFDFDTFIEWAVA